MNIIRMLDGSIIMAELTQEEHFDGISYEASDPFEIINYEVEGFDGTIVEKVGSEAYIEGAYEYSVNDADCSIIRIFIHSIAAITDPDDTALRFYGSTLMSKHIKSVVKLRLHRDDALTKLYSRHDQLKEEYGLMEELDLESIYDEIVDTTRDYSLAGPSSDFTVH